MKLAPISNPHSRIGQVTKKTKAEEKEEVLSKTKTSVLEKYGKKTGNKFTQLKAHMTGGGTTYNNEKEDDFKLEDKITAKSESINLMKEGFVQAYVDFFYITTETTPSAIEPSKQLQEEYNLNKKKKIKFQHSEGALRELSDNLRQAELYLRNSQTDKCLDKYRKVAKDFQDKEDFETASYFYKKCLDVSVQANDSKGQAEAYQGLGTCEEKVHNIFPAMSNLETALEKATDGHHEDLGNVILIDLVRVYQTVAEQFQNQNDFNEALNFFQKCLDATQKAGHKEQEAECYQKIGKIEEQIGNLESAVEFLQKFLHLCEKTGSKQK
jgi:tetratricopeptide (TPR) repeat protein